MEGFHTLQQVVDLEVCVSVVARLHLGALAEQRVCLVEQQDRVAGLRGFKQRSELLLRLADVLGDDAGEVDLIEVQTQLARDQARTTTSGTRTENRSSETSLRD